MNNVASSGLAAEKAKKIAVLRRGHGNDAATDEGSLAVWATKVQARATLFCAAQHFVLRALRPIRGPSCRAYFRRLVRGFRVAGNVVFLALP